MAGLLGEELLLRAVKLTTSAELMVELAGRRRLPIQHGTERALFHFFRVLNLTVF